MQKISEDFDCEYAEAYVRSLLHEYGYSHKTAQKIHVKAALRKEICKWGRKILPMIKEYEESGYTVFVMDESHFVYDSKTGRKYFPRESPYLNAVEKCWRQGRRVLLNSEYYESIEDMKKSVSTYLRTHRFKLSVLKYLKRNPPKQKVMEWKTG